MLKAWKQTWPWKACTTWVVEQVRERGKKLLDLSFKAEVPQIKTRASSCYYLTEKQIALKIT